MKTKNIITSLLFIGFASIHNNSHAQFVNDGSDIFIGSNASIYIEGNFINQADGLIDNEGNIQVDGNWTNNGTTTALVVGNGEVELTGTNQTIDGTNPTDFNNLTLTGNGIKTIDIVTFVGRGGNGVLDLVDATINLTEDTIAILNPSANAIVRNNGIIVSETTVEGPVHWDIGAITGTYVFPMGTSGGVYIPVTVDVTTAGMGNGVISVATYPTAVGNQPLPTGVVNLDLAGQNDSLTVADRFWFVNMLGYTTNPIANIDLTYDNVDDIKSPNTINEDSLVVVSWDNASTTWSPLTSTVNVSSSLVSTSGVNNFEVFALWSTDRTITSVDEESISFANGVSFYPNPSTNGQVNLNLSAEIDGNVFVQFYNGVGQLVYTQNEILNTGQNTLRFNLNAIPTGLYHVVISNEKQQLTTKLVLTK